MTTSSLPSRTRRFLCLWLPNWPIQRLLAQQPKLRQSVVVLYHQPPRKGERVAYCNRWARNVGIQPGMEMAEVAALPRSTSTTSCSQAWHVQAHDAVVDHEALLQLTLECDCFSPIFGIEEGSSAESIFLDVTHSAPRLGGEPLVMTTIHQWLCRLGYRASLAISDTLGAAWGIAHFGLHITAYPFRVCDPLPADRGASTSSASRSLPASFVVPPGQQETALAPLPIPSLRLPASTLETLASLGIHRNEDLFQLPRGSLRARFGPELLQRLDQATGILEERFTTTALPPPLAVSQDLEHATSDREILEHAFLALLTTLAQRLREQDHGALRLECALHLQNRACLSWSINLYQPSCDANHLWELLKMQLEQQAISSPVQQIHLKATLSTLIHQRQTQLFEEVAPARPELAHLLNRLSSRLGRDKILGTRLFAEPLPELAFRCHPLTGDRPQPPTSSSAAARHHQTSWEWRPLSLSDPVRLHLTQKPSGSTQPPTRFHWDGRDIRVRQFWGPERIETRWWRRALVRRDYYQVEDQHGRRIWLYLDLQTRHWYLHGSFD